MIARLGVIMDESKTDEIRRLFASITGHLEDASLIAVEGQSTCIDAVSARQTVSALRTALIEVEDRLTLINDLSNRD